MGPPTTTTTTTMMAKKKGYYGFRPKIPHRKWWFKKGKKDMEVPEVPEIRGERSATETLAQEREVQVHGDSVHFIQLPKNDSEEL